MDAMDSSRAAAHISGPQALNQGATPEATAESQGVVDAAHTALKGMETTHEHGLPRSSTDIQTKNVSANPSKTGLMKKIGQLFSRLFGTITSAFNRSKGQNAVTRLSEKFGTEKATALHTALQSVPKENRKNYTAGVMALSNELSTEDITAAISTYNQEGVAGRTFKADMQTIGQLELIDQQRCCYFLNAPFAPRFPSYELSTIVNNIASSLSDCRVDRIQKQTIILNTLKFTTPEGYKPTPKIP